MPTTINNTLPLNWDSSISYHKGDTVSYVGIIYVSIINNNLNHNPKTDTEYQYWKPLDIYIKDETVMPHGRYSGDDNFWERDNIYIDTNGWVYVNNENTGINVKGRDANIVTFDDLTPEQREQLRGPRGYQGEQGPAGPEGPQGPMGEVILTPEQVAALTGPRGESTYQTWLDQGHTGTPDDFLDWVRTSLTQFDDKLLSTSTNAVENRAIYNALFSYQVYLNTIMEQYINRLQALENRLKAEYQGDEIEFTFGVTNDGKYGYKKQGEQTTIPFDNSAELNGVLQSTEIIETNLMLSGSFATQDSIESSRVTSSMERSGVYGLASMEGTPSVNNDEDDDSTVYGSSAEVMTFEDYADTYYHMFENGAFRGAVTPENILYHLTNDGTRLVSNNAEDIEGFILATDASINYSILKLKVAPLQAGTTVNYQLGEGNANATLPDVVNGTNRTTYTTGSFDEETDIYYNIPNRNQKLYFAKTSNVGYIIKEIYLG